VVDERHGAREHPAVVLEKAGFAVTRAATGRDALRLVRESRPDVIVLDIPVPDVDGVALCRQLKAETLPAGAAIVIVTPALPDVQVPGADLGADLYLTAPVAPAAMVSAVNSLVRLREAEGVLRTRDSLLGIARAVGGTADLTEALRLVCRELARMTGADTVGAHLLERERQELRPVAGYHMPKHALALLASSAVPQQPFWPAILRSAEVVGSDDIGHDERFAFELFRGVPHQSGVVLPLVVEGEVAGTFYLVWWSERRRLDPSEAALLQAVGQQVGLFLGNVRLVEDARKRERQLAALADDLRRAEARYRMLFERSFVGIFRTRADGIVVECNDAFARILGYDTAAEISGRSVLGHYASPADREAVVARLAAGKEVIDVTLDGRRRDGSAVPVAMSVRRIVEGPIHEGVLVDLTDRTRAEEATALRSVAALANAASHEINAGDHPGPARGSQEVPARCQGPGGDRKRRGGENLPASRSLPPILDLRRSGS
jgi:PAS domain S-box-containing protein